MNWNSTQFDGGMPLTLTAAYGVRNVLKHCGENQKSSLVMVSTCEASRGLRLADRQTESSQRVVQILHAIAPGRVNQPDVSVREFRPAFTVLAPFYRKLQVFVSYQLGSFVGLLSSRKVEIVLNPSLAVG